MPLPKDMVQWLRDHPYLQPVNEPVEVDIGGVSAKQFDVRIPAVPADYLGELCEEPCLPVFVDDPEGTPLRLYAGGYRVSVLTVNGQTVVIFVDLEEETPAKAEEVLKTIAWENS